MVGEGVTGFPGVPTIFAVLAELKTLDAVRFLEDPLRHEHGGGAAGQAHHDAARLFPQARIYSMYGLTECKRCTYLPPEDIDRKPTSVGIAIPNTELWLVDEEGNRLGPEPGRAAGHSRRHGDARLLGEARGDGEEAASPGPLPGELVLYTGDYCRLDDEGYLYFVGRMDDIIKSRGEKVAPKEVENVLYNIKGVRDAAVIGVPDEILGQAVKAFVVLEAGVSLTDKDIQRECQAQLENFMVPKYVEIVADLPKTTTGKIKKTDLK